MDNTTLFNFMKGLNIDTFEKLYLEGCKIKEEDPIHIELYRDIDRARKFIESKDPESKKNYTNSINDNRVCMVIPYNLSPDKRLPPDDIIDGQEVAFVSLQIDYYKREILDQFSNNYGEDILGGIKNLNYWKLSKLGRVYTRCWESYVEQYLSGLQTS